MADIENDSDMEEDDSIIGQYAKPGANIPSAVKIKKEVKPFISKRINDTVIQSPHAAGLSPAGYSPAIDVQSENYSNRKQSGNVASFYKCKDSSPWEEPREQTNWTVKTIKPTSDLSLDNYMYMYQKVPDIVQAMDYVVQTLGTEIADQLENLNEGNSEPNHQSLMNTCIEETRYIGRIKSDGKLTEASVLFEGCLEDSNGHVVSLDLSSVDEYDLFPGQVAVVEGTNEMGRCLRASKIHFPKPPPFEMLKIKGKLGTLNILIAAGPFTPSDSLQYEPLKDLISVITKTEPDICILIGPFIESTHQIIQEGIAETFNDLFQKQMEFMKNAISKCSTNVLIVPSYKDVHGEFVYPTPPLSMKSTPKFMMLPDPGLVSVDGVIIGMTSVDVLMHLRQNVLSNAVISSDTLGGLARHLLSQRCFYPLYPVDDSLPFDVEHCVRYGRMEVQPHILIIPSVLKPFIKDVDGTIIVNPNKLVAGNGGGNYARLQVDFSTATENESFTSIADLCIGQIVKI